MPLQSLANMENKKNIEELVVFSGQYDDCAENSRVVIPEGIEEIGENAFREFSCLTEVVLPRSLKRISACAFAGCMNLKRVEMQFGIEEILDEAFSSCSSLTSVNIPDSVKRIGEGCFEACASLSQVKLSESVIMIG